MIHQMKAKTMILLMTISFEKIQFFNVRFQRVEGSKDGCKDKQKDEYLAIYPNVLEVIGFKVPQPQKGKTH